jgi:serine/threonine protein kinase
MNSIRWSDAELLAVTERLVFFVQLLAEQDVFHSDIKPDNIVLWWKSDQR